MAYDRRLAERVRDALKGQRGLTEKEMFGGIGFMLRGNMMCGVLEADLIVRVGPEQHEQAMLRRHVQPFLIRGAPAKGWVRVRPAGTRSDSQLQSWVEAALTAAKRLPSKETGRGAARVRSIGDRDGRRDR